MAACTVTVDPRTPAGGTKYWYTGTLVHDASYATGGQTITQPSEGPVLPEKIDYMHITGGPVIHRYKPKEGATAAKVLAYCTGGTAEKALVELKSAEDLKAITYQFVCLGS